jgi:hypothetical protein
MKIFKTEWILAVGVIALGTVGIVSSNAGCGSSNDSTGGAGSTGAAGTSAAGSTGSGGHGGSAGSAVVPKVSYTFDTATSSDSTMWKLNDYIDGTPAKNLGSYMHPDAGLTLANPPSLVWFGDDSESSASSGSIKVSVTFDSFGQYVDPVINISPTIDLTGRIIYGKIRLVSGTFSAGGIQFHFSTGSTYVYGAGAFVNASDLMTGVWKQLSIDTTTAPAPAGQTLDPSMVIQIGVQITAGTAFDGGAPPSGELVFEIDTIHA